MGKQMEKWSGQHNENVKGLVLSLPQSKTNVWSYNSEVYAFMDYVLSNGQERRECTVPEHLATSPLFPVLNFFLSQEIFKK